MKQIINKFDRCADCPEFNQDYPAPCQESMTYQQWHSAEIDILTQIHPSCPLDDVADGWISVEDKLPESEDNSVLVYFKNGSVEMVHIQDYFDDITCGLDSEGNQLYTKWYLSAKPEVTHWRPLPDPPKGA